MVPTHHAEGTRTEETRSAPRGSSGELSHREVLTGEVSTACRQGETPIPGLSAAVPPQKGIGKGQAVGVVWLLSPPVTKAVWSLWTQRQDPPALTTQGTWRWVRIRPCWGEINSVTYRSVHAVHRTIPGKL